MWRTFTPRVIGPPAEKRAATWLCPPGDMQDETDVASRAEAGDAEAAGPVVPSETDITAIREVLRGVVSDAEVWAILNKLRSWGDPDAVTSAWVTIGSRPLKSILRNLKPEHFSEFPSEISAAMSARDSPKTEQPGLTDGAARNADFAEIRKLLRVMVSDKEADAVLSILRSWGDVDAVTAAWKVIGDNSLERLLNNLTREHFTEFPLEVLACVAAVDDTFRDRKIREKTRGATNAREAALAFFLVMDLDPSDPAQMQALLSTDPVRAQQLEAHIAERIQAALPYAVRYALVEALHGGGAPEAGEEGTAVAESAAVAEFGAGRRFGRADTVRVG